MECGILRVKQITAGGISHIGGEEDRLHGNERNGDIDMERSRLNMSAYREPEQQTLYRAWQDKCAELGVSAQRKGQTAMEQAIITASPDFFARLGWDKDLAKGWTPDDIPPGITQYFEDSLEWAAQYFGEKNIIGATIHFDETTPHVHIDYIPAVESSKRRKDVYARDADGKLIRDEKGHAIRARDENGKVIYDYVEAPARLSRTDYWQQRGGRQSYRKMQDQFFEQVSSKYGLERGEINSGREHIEQERYKAVKAREERQRQQERVKDWVKTDEDITKVSLTAVNKAAGVDTDKIKPVKENKAGLFQKEDTVTLTRSDYDKLLALKDANEAADRIETAAQSIQEDKREIANIAQVKNRNAYDSHEVMANKRVAKAEQWAKSEQERADREVAGRIKAEQAYKEQVDTAENYKEQLFELQDKTMQRDLLEQTTEKLLSPQTAAEVQNARKKAAEIVGKQRRVKEIERCYYDFQHDKINDAIRYRNGYPQFYMGGKWYDLHNTLQAYIRLCGAASISPMPDMLNHLDTLDATHGYVKGVPIKGYGLER